MKTELIDAQIITVNHNIQQIEENLQLLREKKDVLEGELNELVGQKARAKEITVDGGFQGERAELFLDVKDQMHHHIQTMMDTTEQILDGIVTAINRLESDRNSEYRMLGFYKETLRNHEAKN